MMKTLISMPITFFKLMGEALLSPFPSLSEKLSVFSTLFSLQLKMKFLNDSGKPARANIMGYKVTGCSYDTLLFLFREVFLNKSYSFQPRKDKQISIIDCGANIGMSLLFFKKLFPHARILAFEPNPKLFKILEENIRQNRLGDVRAIQAGLSHENGMMDFYFGSDKGGLLGSFLEKRGGGNKVTVATKKLSDFVLELRPDLVKIDVEGAETEILHDLLETNTLNIPNQYIVEYHHKINNQIGCFSNFLIPFEKAGFDYQIRTDFSELNIFQDVLIHFFQPHAVEKDTFLQAASSPRPETAPTV